MVLFYKNFHLVFGNVFSLLDGEKYILKIKRLVFPKNMVGKYISGNEARYDEA